LPRKEEPKPKVSLSRDEIWEVQAWLKAFKLQPGPIDGIPGPSTIAAVKKFEAAHQRPETGNINYVLLGALRVESGLPLR
jgi:peptidoglycan hydrolase-like protein with peptidoglycan-binding domain